jgi:hypothetical protein
MVEVRQQVRARLKVQCREILAPTGVIVARFPEGRICAQHLDIRVARPTLATWAVPRFEHLGQGRGDRRHLKTLLNKRRGTPLGKRRGGRGGQGIEKRLALRPGQTGEVIEEPDDVRLRDAPQPGKLRSGFFRKLRPQQRDGIAP